MKAMLGSLQKLGGALMLPIAVLPIAGLLLRFGQPDLLNLPMMAAAGDAIFTNLGLLFAIGVAVGLARENHGAAGLAAVVAYLVATKGAQVLIEVPPDLLAQLKDPARALVSEGYKAKELAKLTVPVGILCGLMAGYLYNRFYNINLPSYLAFFGGRRFVPIVTGLGGLVLAFLFGWQWQHLEAGMDALSRAVLHAGSFGFFAYGVLNRILIVTGLHHIINSIVWFLVGDFHGVTGDLNRFRAGDPSAGTFMAGFFPVMMFGLPAACLAMYHTALPERRQLVAGLFGSIALTSFLTGVTEPIEFSFMFLAPLLYAVHALLTGVAFVIMNALHVHLGFNFSAGAIDYVLYYKYATEPLWLLPVGALYFALYYVVFRVVIVRFDLKTPGREPLAAAPAAQVPAGERGPAWISALGGAANLISVDACTTRLRLKVADQARVNEEALKALGARGTVRPGPQALQVVIGAIADQLAGEIRAALPAASRGAVGVGKEAAVAPSAGTVAADTAAWQARAVKLLAALGGKANVESVESASTRLLVRIANGERADARALAVLSPRGVARPQGGSLHLIIGEEASVAGAALRQLLT
jgi:PTS system N-acetylglucosamine-specific IIC component